MISPSVVNTYKKIGVGRIPKLFSLAEVNQLRAEILLALANDPQVEVKNGYPTIVYWPEISEAYKERVRPVADKILGNHELVTFQYYFHLPGDPDEFNWHNDDLFRPGTNHDYLQTAILVDDWTEDNNAVEFILGSHKKPWENSGELRKFDRQGLKGKKLFGEAGDLLLWSGMIVHGSEKNQSKTPRAYLMQGFKR